MRGTKGKKRKEKGGKRKFAFLTPFFFFLFLSLPRLAIHILDDESSDEKKIRKN